MKLLDVENRFFTLYKSVDSICRDMFRNEHHYNDKGEEVFGVSAYISIMEREYPSIRYQFPNWNDQYKLLKHLRWLRTQIAHSPQTSECSESDLSDLTRFYQQLMNQTDILALAYQAKKRRNEANKVSPVLISPQTQVPHHMLHKKTYVGWWIFSMAIGILLLVLICYAFK